MHAVNYKKMAGTAAVFISADYAHATPVERGGLIWKAHELHLDRLPNRQQKKPSMATVLALEGLEEYDRPSDGDIRQVDSMGVEFIYCERARARAWVQLT